MRVLIETKYDCKYANMCWADQSPSCESVEMLYEAAVCTFLDAVLMTNILLATVAVSLDVRSLLVIQTCVFDTVDTKPTSSNAVWLPNSSSQACPIVSID